MLALPSPVWYILIQYILVDLLFLIPSVSSGTSDFSGDPLLHVYQTSWTLQIKKSDVWLRGGCREFLKVTCKTAVVPELETFLLDDQAVSYAEIHVAK